MDSHNSIFKKREETDEKSEHLPKYRTIYTLIGLFVSICMYMLNQKRQVDEEMSRLTSSR